MNPENEKPGPFSEMFSLMLDTEFEIPKIKGCGPASETQILNKWVLTINASLIEADFGEDFVVIKLKDRKLLEDVFLKLQEIYTSKDVGWKRLKRTSPKNEQSLIFCRKDATDDDIQKIL